MDALASHGRDLRTEGSKISTTGADVHSTWQGLAGHYDAPEAGQLLAATGPLRSAASAVGADLGSAGDAIVAYADEVRPIQARLRSLQSQARAFVDSVAA